ncbi:MAG: TIGR04211 family SH3 domain-containing protein [Marinobacter sp.]|uniref:TIGR04211 family SH3 domain-containing protein n=1 Tax=Marinobacter sp. TaxID=50741 RepID=UPI00299D3962|nr:TIGR04211 family SH3 domain-containing protein [Marinobacter sp.]MDX1633397.1 TIGR04211 family SH3 domain-containing protein [Marinobacter sp.]
MLATCLPLQAKTVYIDDTLYAPVRSGEGTQYRILHNGLRSGTPVELLERAESGYSRVRTPDGIEGWIVSRYLSEQPIARDRLAAAQQQLERTRNELASVRETLQQTQAERDELANAESRLENRSEELAEELREIKSISANAISLKERNQELQEVNQRLRNDVEVLTAEKERLEAKKESDFMLLGAGLVLLGVILALVVPLLKPTRKHDTWA